MLTNVKEIKLYNEKILEKLKNVQKKWNGVMTSYVKKMNERVARTSYSNELHERVARKKKICREIVMKEKKVLLRKKISFNGKKKKN